MSRCRRRRGPKEPGKASAVAPLIPVQRLTLDAMSLSGVCKLSTAIWGLLTAVAPERVIGTSAQALLVGYENPEDLEPKEWYVQATRVSGLVLAVAALLDYALDGLGGDDEAAAIDEEGAE